jgi:hypothetical protein
VKAQTLSANTTTPLISLEIDDAHIRRSVSAIDLHLRFCCVSVSVQRYRIQSSYLPYSARYFLYERLAIDEQKVTDQQSMSFTATVRKISVRTSFVCFIICTTRSNKQMKATTEFVLDVGAERSTRTLFV